MTRILTIFIVFFTVFTQKRFFVEVAANKPNITNAESITTEYLCFGVNHLLSNNIYLGYSIIFERFLHRESYSKWGFPDVFIPKREYELNHNYLGISTSVNYKFSDALIFEVGLSMLKFLDGYETDLINNEQNSLQCCQIDVSGPSAEPFLYSYSIGISYQVYQTNHFEFSPFVSHARTLEENISFNGLFGRTRFGLKFTF
jgi:hypothetical protein